MNTVKTVLVLLVASIAPAQAAVVISASESGGNVIFSTSGGTLDVSSLTGVGASGPPFVNPVGAEFALGAGGGATLYSGAITGPGSFGTGGFTTSFDGTGDLIGFVYGDLITPGGYVSGDLIGPSTLTIAGTLDSIGITPGTYVWSWADDSVTLNIVPIPAAVWLFGSALAGLGWFQRESRPRRTCL